VSARRAAPRRKPDHPRPRPDWVCLPPLTPPTPLSPRRGERGPEGIYARRGPRSRCAFALLIAVAAAPPLAAQDWQELGPSPVGGGDLAGTTGRVAALALSRHQADAYYAASASGGVWRSTDGGQSWSALSDYLPTTALGAIALDPRDEAIVYAGSGEANYAYHSLYGAGVYKSTDGGDSFQVLAANRFAGQAFSRLAVAPDGTVWAAVSRAGGTAFGFEGARQHRRRNAPMGLFRSANGGKTWALIRRGLPNLPAADVDIDPRDPRRIFVTAGDVFGNDRNGVYLSTDAGNSFREVLGVEGSSLGRIALAIAPSDPDFVYAIASRPPGRETTGGFTPQGDVTLALFASTDGGQSWGATDPGNFLGDQGVYDIAIAVAPDDPRTVILGGVQLLRSTDGGMTFANITPPHVDIHDLAFDAAGRLVSAGDGGIHRSSDLGRTWETLNGGLGAVQYYAGMALSPVDPELVVVGSQDNGTHVRRPDGSWDQVFGGDGGWVAGRPEDPDVFVVQFQGAGNVFLTQDGGLTFANIRTGIAVGDRTAFQAPLLFGPDTETGPTLYYATHRLWAAEDASGFHLRSDDLTTGAPWAIRSLATAPANADVLYATTSDGGVLVSSDRGVSWERVRDRLAGWPRIMRQVAVDPADPDVAAVVDGGFGGARVLLTKNRGRTWTEIGRRLPDLPIFAVAIERVDGRRHLFVGTDRGVYATGGDGKSWTRYGAALPNAPVHDLVVDVAHGRVVAATLGRGVWWSALVAVR
jgi:photosystem II stability/assembly factor-like uncharacterized protein